MRAVAYIRVSTDEQHLGPEAQRAAIAQWAEQNGAEVVVEHCDLGVSGGAPLDKRPGLLAAVGSLRDADVLVVAKRDRLARDTMTAAMVERMAARAKATIRSADGVGNGDGPEALLMRRLVDAFAEYERALIGARTRAALSVKRSRGERTGGDVPLGYQATGGGQLERDQAEAEALDLISKLRAEGRSIRAVAAELNRRGVPSRGKRWHPTTVARLLKRDRARWAA